MLQQEHKVRKCRKSFRYPLQVKPSDNVTVLWMDCFIVGVDFRSLVFENRLPTSALHKLSSHEIVCSANYLPPDQGCSFHRGTLRRSSWDARPVRTVSCCRGACLNNTGLNFFLPVLLQVQSTTKASR